MTAPTAAHMPARALQRFADRKAAEVLSKYVITDMCSKAAQRMPAEEAVKWAHDEVAKVHV